MDTVFSFLFSHFWYLAAVITLVNLFIHRRAFRKSGEDEERVRRAVLATHRSSYFSAVYCLVLGALQSASGLETLIFPFVLPIHQSWSVCLTWVFIFIWGIAGAVRFNAISKEDRAVYCRVIMNDFIDGDTLLWSVNVIGPVMIVLFLVRILLGLLGVWPISAHP